MNKIIFLAVHCLAKFNFCISSRNVLDSLKKLYLNFCQPCLISVGNTCQHVFQRKTRTPFLMKLFFCSIRAWYSYWLVWCHTPFGNKWQQFKICLRAIINLVMCTFQRATSALILMTVLFPVGNKMNGAQNLPD